MLVNPRDFLVAEHMVLEDFNDFLLIVSLTPGSDAAGTHMWSGGWHVLLMSESRCNEQTHVESLEGVHMDEKIPNTKLQGRIQTVTDTVIPDWA